MYLSTMLVIVIHWRRFSPYSSNPILAFLTIEHLEDNTVALLLLA